jgi:hypothetical protein
MTMLYITPYVPAFKAVGAIAAKWRESARIDGNTTGPHYLAADELARWEETVVLDGLQGLSLEKAGERYTRQEFGAFFPRGLKNLESAALAAFEEATVGFKVSVAEITPQTRMVEACRAIAAQKMIDEPKEAEAIAAEIARFTRVNRSPGANPNLGALATLIPKSFRVQHGPMNHTVMQPVAEAALAAAGLAFREPPVVAIDPLPPFAGIDMALAGPPQALRA